MSTTVSKLVQYSVLSPSVDNVAVTKLNTYTVLSPIDNDLAVSKLNAYTVLTPNASIALAKILNYTVLSSQVTADYFVGGAGDPSELPAYYAY